MESSSRIEGGSRKCIIASALILFFASVAVFQFSLISNNLTIADVIGTTDETRRLQIATTPHGFGEFYVTMYVGEPPQPQRLQVVTDVDYTTMICEDCYHCGTSHFDSPFNPVASSSAQYAQCGACLDPEARCTQTTNQCLLTSHFLGSLASAVEVYDQVLIDYTSTTISETIPRNLAQHGLGLKFQCANFLDAQAALTKSVADGYLSMSPAKTSFLQQLHDAGGITKRVFSMCFRDAQQKFQPAGASAGTLLLGAIMNPNRFKTPLVYARNSATQVKGIPSGYFINVRRIYLALGVQSDTLMRVSQSALGMLPIENAAGRSMDVYNRVNGASGNVEVDINKPYTLLHRDLMAPFTASFLNVTGLTYDRKGIPMTPSQFKQLPTIVLQLEASDSEHVGGYVLVGVPGLIGEFDPVHPMDILVAIPPQHYLIYDARKKIATPTVIFDTTVSFIGSNVLQGHQVVFDLDQVRIGFAEQECTAGLSLVISDTDGSSTIRSHARGGDALGDGNNTAEAGNNTTSQVPLDGVTVSSDQTSSTTSSVGGAESSSVGQEWSDGGASAQAGFVSSSEAGHDVLSSIAASTTGSEGANTVTTAATSSGSSNTVTTPMGLPKPSDTENQSMRYGPAVTSPYSYARAQADSSSVKTASSSNEAPEHRTGGSDLLWYLMAGTAFLMGFGLTVAGTRPENAVHAAPQWGRGDVRADDGLSVFDANTTVYGGRKQAYGSSGKSVMGGNKSVMGGNKSVSGGKSVMGGNRSVAGGNKSVAGGNKSVMGGNRSVVGSKQTYEAPAAKKQVYEGPTATKQVYEGPAATKQVYEGPTATKQVYEGPTATKQVYEGPTNTKQVYEGPGSEHSKTASTSKEPGMFSKGIFGGGKKKKEVANDGGTVATGWSQGSGSFFSRAQSKAATSTKKSRKGGKEAARDDVTAFTYGSQSYYGHNLD